MIIINFDIKLNYFYLYYNLTTYVQFETIKITIYYIWYCRDIYYQHIDISLV